MAIYQGFIGGSYASRWLKFDAERAINYYYEPGQPGSATKSQAGLYQRPGLALFATLIDQPLRGLWGGDNRLIAASGSTLYELSATGNATVLGNINPAATPVQIFPNGTQLFVVSGDQGYVATGTAILPVIPARTGAFLDSFFIAAQPQSNRFVISDPLNGKNWSGLEFGVKQGYPDNIASILATRRDLWLFGTQTTEVWLNTGNANFPFERSLVAPLIEQGCGAPFSPAEVANSPMWLSASTRGARAVWRAQGYTPVRVSTYAMEEALRTYSNVGDAVGYSYEEDGHSFYHLSFPSANIAWVYDATTGFWHERDYLDPITGQPRAPLARFHAYTLDKHFVGDWRNGNIYVQSLDFVTDNGDPMRRVRVAPDLSSEDKWIFYNRLQVDVQVGYAPVAGPGSDPQIMMQFSDDGGITFKNEHWMSMGKAGDFLHRAIWNRLGRSRNRVFKIVVTDPVQAALIGAYLNN